MNHNLKYPSKFPATLFIRLHHKKVFLKIPKQVWFFNGKQTALNQELEAKPALFLWPMVNVIFF